ncbi:MAG: glycosyltransferase family 2 protein [Lewinella sp.]|nr:glycosyltransferase family 2 protein [Lewinella sp.]
MLSILIPTYRYPLLPLLTQLLAQLQGADYGWEIRAYDDGSPAEWRAQHRPLGHWPPQLVYRELSKNLGRAAVRNLLAREAKYTTLLFLDADGRLPHAYLTAYLPYCAGQSVVCGGRSYGNEAVHAEQFLHWTYGRQRESRSAAARRRQPYLGFQTNNFLAPRALLLRHPFAEVNAEYGHEDTLWGWQLAALGVPIVHIDNAVDHLGLEAAPIFLAKQRQAVSSLRRLEALAPDLPTQLGRWAARLGPLQPLLRPFLRGLSPRLEQRLLTETSPSLYYLDALKLYWYWTERLK